MNPYENRLLRDINETLESVNRLSNKAASDLLDVHTLRNILSQTQQLNIYVANLLGAQEFKFNESLTKEAL